MLGRCRTLITPSFLQRSLARIQRTRPRRLFTVVGVPARCRRRTRVSRFQLRVAVGPSGVRRIGIYLLLSPTGVRGLILSLNGSPVVRWGKFRRCLTKRSAKGCVTGYWGDRSQLLGILRLGLIRGTTYFLISGQKAVFRVLGREQILTTWPTVIACRHDLG